MKGKHHTQESKKKISLTMMGKNMGKKMSIEAREKMSESHKGKKLTEEHKKKIGQSMKGKFVGDKSPFWGVRGDKANNWRGGIKRDRTNLSDRNQRVTFQIEMQKLVFERDDYTCQLCGIRGVDLQVDHIQSWAEYVKLRFSMDNCRTLCAKCHYKITFGKLMPENLRGWGHNLLKGRVTP